MQSIAFFRPLDFGMGIDGFPCFVDCIWMYLPI